MYRKKAVVDAGNYYPRTYPTEDLDLWIRLGKDYEFSNVDEFLFKYRVLSKSVSHQRLIRLEMKVVLVRMIAVAYHGYKPTMMDILYNVVQLATSFLMPSKFRYKLFNFLRNNDLI